MTGSDDVRVSMAADSLLALLDLIDELSETYLDDPADVDGVRLAVACVLSAEGIVISRDEVGIDMGTPIYETGVQQVAPQTWELLAPDGERIAGPGLWPQVAPRVGEWRDVHGVESALALRLVACVVPGEDRREHRPELDDDGTTFIFRRVEDQ